MRIIIILLTVTLCFTNCDSKLDRDNSKEEKAETDSSKQNTVNHNHINVFSDSLLLKTEFISKDEYSLRLESYFFHKEADYENVHLNKVVQKQVLNFLHNDTVLKVFTLPVKMIQVEGVRIGKSVPVQENNLYKICMIFGNKDWLYCIKGSGIMDSQTEYYGLFSKQGKLLWYSYTSYQNINEVQEGIPDEGFGNIDKILSVYGITEKEFNKPIFCKDISY